MTLPLPALKTAVDLTHDFQAALANAPGRIHRQTQVVNTGGVDNPPYSESSQYCRTEKRISAYG